MIEPVRLGEDILLYHGDCLDVLATLEANSVDAVVTDPPYGLSFMGKDWDHGVPGEHFWAEILRVCKPGAMLLAFGGTRTHHRLMVAIEDAGWEIRDCLMWLYGSGFPKSLSIGKALDKAAGAEREVVGMKPKTGGGRAAPSHEGWQRPWMQEEGARDKPFQLTTPATPEAAEWEGWGTALKPAWEPIILAMKPLDGTYANNALTHGVAGLNIDGCRVGTEDETRRAKGGWQKEYVGAGGYKPVNAFEYRQHQGRWPANLLLSHHPDCERVGMRRVRGAGWRDGDKRQSNFGGAEAPGHGQSGHYADADGMEEVADWRCHPDCAVALLDAQAGPLKTGAKTGQISRPGKHGIYGKFNGAPGYFEANEGHASRFFQHINFGPEDEEALRFAYVPKASRAERNQGLEGMEERPRFHGGLQGASIPLKGSPMPVEQNNHPTVKPLALMRYLITLVTRPEHTVLDPFMGSGSTGRAAVELGRGFIGIDSDEEAFEIAKRRIADAQMQMRMPI